MSLESVGEDIRARREAVGLSRLELAARAGASITTLQNIEGGIVPRRSIVMPRIQRVLDELEAHRNTVSR